MAASAVRPVPRQALEPTPRLVQTHHPSLYLDTSAVIKLIIEDDESEHGLPAESPRCGP